MQLLSGDQLRAVEAHLSALLDRTLAHPVGPDAPADACDGLSAIGSVIRAFVLAGGKRLRPQLCVWTYEQSSGFRVPGSGRMPTSASAGPSTEPRTLNPEPLLDLACAWELFHAFLLAHDDIIDGADRRRDEPSLHVRLSALDGRSPRFGANLGIVAGDLLFSAAVSLLHELDVPDATTHRRLLKLFSRTACTTGFGQAIDICQSHAPPDAVREQTLLREYGWKTAAYTFEGPMLSGAILAGACDAAQAALSRYALALGQAYQLHNDLKDLAEPAREGCDLVEGKRTVTLMRARAAMPEPARRAFDERCRDVSTANGQAVALAEVLRQEVLATGASSRTVELIRSFLEAARAATDDPALPATLVPGLRALLDALEREYFVHV